MRHLKSKKRSKNKKRSKSKNRRKLSRGIRRLRLDGGFDDLPEEIKIYISEYNPTARDLFNLALLSKANKDIYLDLARNKNIKEQIDIQEKLNELELKDETMVAISLDEFKKFLKMPGITEVSFYEYYEGLDITINEFKEISLRTLELKLEEGQSWDRSDWMDGDWQGPNGLDQKIFDFCLKKGNIKELTKFAWGTRFDDSIRYDNLIIPSNLKELSITSMGEGYDWNRDKPIQGTYHIPEEFLKDTNIEKLTIGKIDSIENFKILLNNLVISDKIKEINIMEGLYFPCDLKNKFEEICAEKNITSWVDGKFDCY